jgi:hypothetical protein
MGHFHVRDPRFLVLLILIQYWKVEFDDDFLSILLPFL